jgi:hypothetical protein
MSVIVSTSARRASITAMRHSVFLCEVFEAEFMLPRFLPLASARYMREVNSQASYSRLLTNPYWQR